jgi:hypothetical protein
MAIVIKNGIITELKTSTSGKNLAFGDFVGKAIVSGSVVANSNFTNTAEFYYDAGNVTSYVGSGTTLTNIGTLGNVTGTLGTMTGVGYESGIASGVFNFDGVSYCDKSIFYSA